MDKRSLIWWRISSTMESQKTALTEFMSIINLQICGKRFKYKFSLLILVYNTLGSCRERCVARNDPSIRSVHSNLGATAKSKGTQAKNGRWRSWPAASTSTKWESGERGEWSEKCQTQILSSRWRNPFLFRLIFFGQLVNCKLPRTREEREMCEEIGEKTPTKSINICLLFLWKN